MRAILARLFSRPVLGFELLVATLFANALALAAPIFVIQVLNRYVAFGVDTTLATLTAGAVIAVVFEFGFRRVRLKLAQRAAQPFDDRAAETARNALLRTPFAVFSMFTDRARFQAASGPDTIRSAYGAANMLVMLDVPFALLFIGVLALLSPVLALIASGFAVAILLLGIVGQAMLRTPAGTLERTGAIRQKLTQSAIRAADTLRLFDTAGYIERRWRQSRAESDTAQASFSSNQDFISTVTQTLQSLLTVTMIAVGGYLVVQGPLDVGALIGANILAARAIMPLGRLAGIQRAFAVAAQSRLVLDELETVQQERRGGVELSGYTGAVSLKDTAFVYPGQRAPVFEHLSVDVAPGQTLAISGPNGSGKSTVAQLITGLRTPTRGNILIDGTDLEQVSPEWWRRQISYLPQEPKFLPGTVRENLLAANPALDEAGLNALIAAAGLGPFINASTDGLDMEVRNGGDHLALGIRRRLALARALAVGGKILIVDEPTEGLDEEGRALVYATMNTHAQKGGTIIACSFDPNIIKGAEWVVDLSSKPEPRVTRLPRPTNMGVGLQPRVSEAGE
ncbi:MAG: ATP-binding cassette domain-containing protein [Rhodospirillales bacterium]|nr:ATP-binding cassette domain-containing protein [Rhodospirillales bacterium]